MTISKNSKGASSVLVILILLVLVVFGLSALSSSLAGIRLSDKNFKWSEEYYALESNVEEVLFEIDRILANAEEDAINRTIYEYETDSGMSSKEYLEKWFSTTFLESAIKDLEKLEKNGLIKLSAQNTDAILIYASFSQENNNNSKNIDLEIKVNAPEYEFDTTGKELSGIRLMPEKKRYTIMAWKEWQKPFEYEGDMDFTDL